MDISNLMASVDPTTVLLITASTVGLTEFIKEVANAIKNFKTLGAVDAIKAPATVFASFIVGGAVGLASGYSFLLGGIIGLAASGIYKLTKNVG